MFILHASMGLDEAQQFVQRLEDQSPAAGGVLDIAPPQRAAVGPREALLPPDANDEGVSLWEEVMAAQIGTCPDQEWTRDA
ncbi:MAG: hypothetical protein DRI80_16850 [Chloroflexota bacterium]|nr:MAG: hypothetical protein DRI80_16850 [Chloroflexota bacterium]